MSQSEALGEKDGNNQGTKEEETNINNNFYSFVCFVNFSLRYIH